MAWPSDDLLDKMDGPLKALCEMSSTFLACHLIALRRFDHVANLYCRHMPLKQPKFVQVFLSPDNKAKFKQRWKALLRLAKLNVTGMLKCSTQPLQEQLSQGGRAGTRA